MELKEDDIVFCTVKKVERMNVFVEIVGNRREGTVVMSEIAAGRIRNIREYVSPGRKIVCKILRIREGHIELSLRRVTVRERTQAQDAYKKERALVSVLKTIGEEPEKILDKIRGSYSLVDFFEEVRENKKLFEEFLSKEKAAKVIEMFTEKAVKERKVERKFSLVSFSESGVKELKEILHFEDKEVDIRYLGSGIFSVSVTGSDLKKQDLKVEEVLGEIEKRAKNKKAVFEVKRK